MIFENRETAGRELAQKLNKYKDTNSVILAIPRGGVPVGYVIAHQLHLPLDILLSKKIGHPFNKEFAIGAVTPYGYMINEEVEDVDNNYIHEEVIRIKQLLELKRLKFRGTKQAIDLKGKTVIIVDDGIATGQTIIASLKNIRSQEPKKIIIAVPVAPSDRTQILETLADEYICLHQASNFNGIGEFYKDFSQVNDEEVIELLK